jgi:hypothetical protein
MLCKILDRAGRSPVPSGSAAGDVLAVQGAHGGTSGRMELVAIHQHGFRKLVKTPAPFS